MKLQHFLEALVAVGLCMIGTLVIRRTGTLPTWGKYSLLIVLWLLTAQLVTEPRWTWSRRQK
jgi:hypothetical protein